MDHSGCFPKVRRHTHSRIRSIYSMDMRHSKCEAFLVTTTFPVKNFLCQVLSWPTLPGDHSNQNVVSSVRPRELGPHEEDVMASDATKQLVSQDTDFADALKCRILFWNCTGICHCRFRDAVRRISDRFGVDIAIIVGGPTHDATISTFWSSLGLAEGIPWDFNFDGSGPSVTVRYDEALMEVGHLGIGPSFDGRLELRVHVDRPLYIPAVEYALAHQVESSDESDVEANNSD